MSDWFGKGFDLPTVGQIVCNSRMRPDARLIAPSQEASYQGIPILIREDTPDGTLVLVDCAGKVIGVVTS